MMPNLSEHKEVIKQIKADFEINAKYIPEKIATLQFALEVLGRIDEEKITEHLDFEYHNDRIPSKFNYSDLQIISKAITTYLIGEDK